MCMHSWHMHTKTIALIDSKYISFLRYTGSEHGRESAAVARSPMQNRPRPSSASRHTTRGAMSRFESSPNPICSAHTHWGSRPAADDARPQTSADPTTWAADEVAECVCIGHRRSKVPSMSELVRRGSCVRSARDVAVPSRPCSLAMRVGGSGPDKRLGDASTCARTSPRLARHRCLLRPHSFLLGAPALRSSQTVIVDLAQPRDVHRHRRTMTAGVLSPSVSSGRLTHARERRTSEGGEFLHRCRCCSLISAEAYRLAAAVHTTLHSSTTYLTHPPAPATRRCLRCTAAACASHSVRVVLSPILCDLHLTCAFSTTTTAASHTRHHVPQVVAPPRAHSPRYRVRASSFRRR